LGAFIYSDFFGLTPPREYLYFEKELTMKTQTKNTTDALLHRIIAELKKRGTRCGTGAEMKKLREKP
jgi:hypothetical protein